jgi:O-antigen ligase
MKILDSSTFEEILLVLIAVSYPLHGIISVSGKSVNISVGDVFILFICIMFLVGFFSPVSVPRLIFVPLLLVLAPILSSLMAMEYQYFQPLESVTEILKLIGGIAWGVALTILLSHNPRPRIWKFSLTSVIVASLFSIITVIRGLVLGVIRPSGPFANPNLYADYLLLNIFLLLLLSYWIRHKRSDISKGLAVLVGAMLSIALIQTKSRAAFAALFLGVVFSIRWATLLDKSRMREVPTVKSGVVIVIVIPAVFFSGMYRRFRSAIEGGIFGRRGELWQRAADTASTHPISGLGWGQVQYAVDTTGVPITTHNTFVRYLVETGLLGGTIFIVFSVITIIQASRISRHSQFPLRFLGGYIIATYASSVFHDIINYRTFWIAFALLCGFLLYHERDKEINDSSHGCSDDREIKHELAADTSD